MNNKILIILTIISAVFLITGCVQSPDIKKCKGVEYNISLARCVQICPQWTPDCSSILTDNYWWEQNNQEYIALNPNYCNIWNSEPDVPCMDHHIQTFEQDKIDEENRERQDKINAEILANKTTCYNKGTFYNYTFDIIKDYNLSCSSITYINDHLIDSSRKVDGGYISGHYSGFVSYGSIEGHLYDWVTEGILATGTLVKNINYHIDCNNSSLTINGQETKAMTYYTESDFVMYYVRNCIEN